MKKIMTMVAAVTIAGIASAANFTWGLGSADFYDKDGETFMDYGTAFLYLGTVTASETAFDLSGATLLTYGGFDAENWIYGNLNADALSSSDSLVSTAAGQAYTIVLVNKNVTSLDGFEGNYALVNGVSEQESVPGATVSYFGKFENYDTIMTSNTMAVPEPTSGLLLLLGMAGLALRRKQA